MDAILHRDNRSAPMRSADLDMDFIKIVIFLAIIGISGQFAVQWLQPKSVYTDRLIRLGVFLVLVVPVGWLFGFK